MRKNFMSKVLAGALATALTVTSVLPAFAANVDETTNLTNSDVINTSLTGSLTITKYDMNAAENAGDYDSSDTSRATGEQDSQLETDLANYAIQGVVFKYLKVGEIEQYSYTDSSTGESTLKVVYEIPTALAAILGLDNEINSNDDGTENDAVNMQASGVAEQCTTAGVLHYTSDQINSALKALLETGTTGKNALEDYMNNNGGTAMDETDSNGQTSEDGLPLGLYLIVETSVPENVTITVNPFFVSLPMTNLQADGSQVEGGDYWLYNVYVYPKNETGNPTLDKMVRNATGEAADSVGESEDMSKIVTNTTDVYATYGALTDLDTDNDKDATDFALQRGDGTYTNGTDATGEYEYASTTTASAGDVLDYILVSNLPHITSNATALTQYSFKDVLSAGLTYNGDMKIAFYASAEDANINNTAKAKLIWTIPTDPTATTYFTVNESTDADGVTTLTVDMTTAGLNIINGVDANGDTVPANSYSDMYMVVYYTATVNSDATTVLGDNGNNNEVTLTWSRTNSSYTDTLEDESVVYVYGIDLTKQFADGTDGYTDVEFVLYNQTDGYYVVADKSADGTYYVTGKTTTEDDATKFVPSSTGSLYIYGLEGDTYSLTEVQTADGYNLLDGEMVIVISTKSESIQAAKAGYTDASGSQDKTPMSVLSTVDAGVTVDGETSTLVASGDSDHALVKLLVVNTQAFVLPITGGAGLYAVTIIGVVAIAAGLFFFFGRKNQKKEAQAQ